jgi:predicted DNA-binding transcriptional regulator AlpA
MTTAEDPHQLMRLTEVAALIAVKPRTIKSWVTKGTFPKPMSPTDTLRLWRRADVVAWVEARP